MYNKLPVFFVCLLCMFLSFSDLHTQDLVLKEKAATTVYLYQENMPLDVVDLEGYVQSGKIEPVVSCKILPPKITPGPAPDPYPVIGMMEKRFEQLGMSSEACDGIWFINGNLWHPNKWALVMWKVRIPDANHRLASEFEKDITLSLWVDWNQDHQWSRNEKVLCNTINIKKYFPTLFHDMNVYYLAMFRIPTASMVETMSGKNIKLETKVWARGVISYDDPDTSPDGQCLFGECEDYNINYFEILNSEKTKS